MEPRPAGRHVGGGKNDGPTVDRFPGVGAVHLQQIKTGGAHWDHKQNRVKTKNGQKQRRSPGNERRFGRGGQPLGPLKIKAPLTLEGVPSRIKKGYPLGRRWETMGRVANGRWIVRNSHHWGRRRRPERSSDRPIPVTPIWASDRVDTRYRSPVLLTGRCDRLKTFDQFREGTAMFGRGVSRNP